MSNFIIVCDSNSELPLSYKEEHDVPVLYMPYTIDGVEYFYDLGKSIDIDAFYERLEQGAMPTTAQRNSYEFIEFWTPLLEQGKDILYIAFSAALSGTFANALQAVETLKEQFPERRIRCVDTKCISVGISLLVMKAIDMQNQGKSLDEIAQWVEDNRMRVNHWFTVMDLNHLKRGGRVSSTTAFMGSLLEIKPILHVNEEGKLVPWGKAKGRKKSMRAIAQKMVDNRIDPKEILFIPQAHCPEDAEALKEICLELVPELEHIWINPVGPVIGTHAGSGVLAVVFFGEHR